jgi:cell shape-determining protein MreC
VLTRPPFSPYDTLIIDAGFRDGINNRDRVYANASVAIGEVTAVYRSSSVVTLYSSPSYSLPVSIGESKSEVEAIGRGGGNFRAIVPAEFDVEIGDEVRLIDSRSMVLGIVEEVEVDSTGSLQTVLFKSPIPFSDLSSVEVKVGLNEGQ